MYIDPTTFEIVPMSPDVASQYANLTAVKSMQSDLEVWASIGGWSFNDPGPTATTFSDLAASESAQQNFIGSLMAFLIQYNFDGVDIDW